MLYPENYLEMNELANQCRREWNIAEYDSIDIFSLIQDKIKNLTIVFKSMDDEISGACYKKFNQIVIFLNSKHSLGRQRFTLAHELYHVKYDEVTFQICNINSNDEIEKKADDFASCLLMPNGALESYKKDNNIKNWDLDLIIQTEQFFQISHSAMIWRIRNLEEITYEEYQNYKVHIKLEASNRGYDLKLYTPYSNKEFSIGNYIRLTEKALKCNKISQGKREELLLDAFCDDLVYKRNMGDLVE